MTDGTEAVQRLLDRLPVDITQAVEGARRCAMIETQDCGFRLIAIILSPGASRAEAEMLLGEALDKLIPAHKAGHA